ncbi:RagB/SusD family nutrient uptake outer membrane protein [Flavobacterium sp.]|uniref:RagB/SusD family nutrient uptake outer membrane protein n=1 Tax=Flavobacterium sp. TaxID=239 RepID=UPI002FDB8496
MKNRTLFQQYKKVLVILTLAFCFQNCDDFVEVNQPNSQLTTQAVFENATTARAALTDIYAQMREHGILTGRINGLSCLLGTYSDELISYENGIYTTEPFYNNALSASMTYIGNIWNRSYSQVYAANAVIEGINNSTTIPENLKNQIKGEALFIRALIHFHLVNLYGDIPFITTTNYMQNSVVTRQSKELVYQNIINDLEQAVSLVEANYVQAGRNRPNKATVQALLARVYLYNENYPQAANWASAVINETALYSVVNNLDQAFLRTSTSTIWQLSPGPNGPNTYEGSIFIFLAGPPTRVSLSQELINKFETNDLRKVHWIKSVTNGTNVWYHPFKYKQNNPTASSQENSIIFRIEEQILIRAEARARQGEIIGAIEDINTIRNRAGLPNTTAVTQSEVIEAIRQERQVEFFTELGHRFFDLKRWNLLNQELAYKPGWNNTDVLWPLPLAEMNANPFLTPQNPGY